MATLTKADLLDKLIDNPLQFSEEDFEALITDATLTFTDIRHGVLRIFDINERIFQEESDANNVLNRKTFKKRETRFYEKFRKGSQRANGKVIVAEGDSWFQFPVFIKDIIDHLNDNPKYSIYSLAYGGDWLTNIIYDGRYVEKLSVFNPDAFLVSGGGNDLVGSDRIGIMINSKCNCPLRHQDLNELDTVIYQSYGQIPFTVATGEDKKIFLDVQKYIRPSFYSFLHIMKLQYSLMFHGIHKKFPDMKIITQAYDYAIPSPDYHGGWFSIQHWVNKLLGTGRWMYIPMTINGFTDRTIQKNIIRYMIFHFNLMFARIANTSKNVFHIDCRGVAERPDHWYDELHLKSARFKVIANAYEKCLDDTTHSTKIYFANPSRSTK